jgi:hypothetical protein
MNFRAAAMVLGGAMALFALAAENDVALGDVKIDARGRSISFPAQVNQRTGAVEYLLVHETGKVHESIFKTAVSAKEIHAAALLFSTTNKPPLKVKSMDVSWQADGKEKRLGVADLILDKKKKGPLRETKWAYRGSRVVNGVFLAERDGSLIAIMADRDALVEQDTPDAADDQNWEPVTDRLPPLGTKVTVGIVFAE